MNDDEKLDVWKMLLMAELSTCLDQLDTALLDTECAMLDEELETDYKVLCKVSDYVEHLANKVDKIVLDLAAKHGMDTETEDEI